MVTMQVIPGSTSGSYKMVFDLGQWVNPCRPEVWLLGEGMLISGAGGGSSWWSEVIEHSGLYD